MSFDKYQDVALIKLVKENEVLYNPKHDMYLDSEYRESVWRSIGESLKKPAGRCKTRWVNIRDNFRRKLAKNQTNKYRYEDKMRFVVPFFRSFNNKKAESNEDCFEDASASEKNQLDGDIRCDDVEMKPDVSTLNRSVEESSNLASNQTYNCSFLETQRDPVSIFLEAVGSTMRSLNPYYLNQAKTRIFQVVLDCELQQIVNKGEPPNSESK